MRFGVFADCQYALKDYEEYEIPGMADHMYHCDYRKSLAKLEQLVARFNDAEVNFVVGLGDIVDDKTKDIPAVTSILTDLNMPMFHVLGNHDLKDSTSTKNDVIELLGMPSNYYSTAVGSFVLIFLDTNEYGVIGKKPASAEYLAGLHAIDAMKSKGAAQAYPWNGGLDEQQLSWLKTTLHETSELGKDAVIFSHHPFYPTTPLVALNSNAVLHIANGFDQKLYAFAGHNHYGDHGLYAGRPYITVSGVLECETPTGAIVSISSEGMSIDGIGKQRSYTFDEFNNELLII